MGTVAEKPPRTIIKHFDPELGSRYDAMVEAGKKLFQGTGLVNPEIPLTQVDIWKIQLFYGQFNPVGIKNPWRRESLEHRDEIKQPNHVELDKDKQAHVSIKHERLPDLSTYGNWLNPGSAKEHINLSSKAAAIILRELKSHPKPEKQVPTLYEHHLPEVQNAHPFFMRATALLHDVGRLLTHTFHTNDRIGEKLLREIGIREDIIQATPDEMVMLVPRRNRIQRAHQRYAQLLVKDPNGDISATQPKAMNMREMFASLSAEAIIMRIADEFGKRKPGSNQIYPPEAYDAWDRNQWANNYTKRPSSGRLSEKLFRQNVQLHVDNVLRYFVIMDYWIRSVSTLSLKDITNTLEKELGHTLAPLPRPAQ